MKIQRRWFFWGLIFFILLVLVAIVAGYIGRNFIGLGPIPTRSAFAGRLPGTPEGDRTRFQFFYATNRENSKDTFNVRGNHLGKDLLTGYQINQIYFMANPNSLMWYSLLRMFLHGHLMKNSRKEFRNCRSISPPTFLQMIERC